MSVKLYSERCLEDLKLLRRLAENEDVDKSIENFREFMNVCYRIRSYEVQLLQELESKTEFPRWMRMLDGLPFCMTSSYVHEFYIRNNLGISKCDQSLLYELVDWDVPVDGINWADLENYHALCYGRYPIFGDNLELFNFVLVLVPEFSDEVELDESKIGLYINVLLDETDFHWLGDFTTQKSRKGMEIISSIQAFFIAQRGFFRDFFPSKNGKYADPFVMYDVDKRYHHDYVLYCN